MINFSSLESLSKVLNHQNIIWGVGGSCLLSLHHLYENPHDLDLWVQPSDMSKLRIIFKEYQELPNDLPLPEKYRYKIKFHDTDVDFIACFIVKPNQHTFEYNINPNNLEYINCNGFKIPCTYLEDWYIIYRLLRKDDKADLIKKVFEAKKIWINDNAIRTAISSDQISIPLRVKSDVYKLIAASTQMTMYDRNVGYPTNEEYNEIKLCPPVTVDSD